MPNHLLPSSLSPHASSLSLLFLKNQNEILVKENQYPQHNLQQINKRSLRFIVLVTFARILQCPFHSLGQKSFCHGCWTSHFWEAGPTLSSCQQLCSATPSLILPVSHPGWFPPGPAGKPPTDSLMPLGLGSSAPPPIQLITSFNTCFHVTFPKVGTLVSLHSCVTLSTLHNLSEPWVPHGEKCG